MLEEYLCLGGTEIANNARAYGYATTSGCPTSWFRCEPCDTLREATGDWIPPTYRSVELARNLYTNPSFEDAAGIPSGATQSTDWSMGGTYSLLVEVGCPDDPTPPPFDMDAMYADVSGVYPLNIFYVTEA
jgi:hypothetical protein